MPLQNKVCFNIEQNLTEAQKAQARENIGAEKAGQSISWKMWSRDNGSTGDESSIYIGKSSTALNKSIVLGDNNESMYGYYPHGIVSGHNNKVYNNLEYLCQAYSPTIVNYSANSSVHTLPLDNVYASSPNLTIKGYQKSSIALTKTIVSDDRSMPDYSYNIQSDSVIVKVPTNYEPDKLYMVYNDVEYEMYLYYSSTTYRILITWTSISSSATPTFSQVQQVITTTTDKSLVTNGSNKYFFDLNAKNILIANTVDIEIEYNAVVDPTGPLTANVIDGVNNTIYGHNGISIGANNISGDAEHWVDTYYDPSKDGSAAHRGEFNYGNDGFAVTVGFGCHAYRNYDFAYGYKSIANGGENIAFQQGKSIGYRNVTINTSSINGGISNVLISNARIDSDTETAYWNHVTDNFVWNAYATLYDVNTGSTSLHNNFIGNANVFITTTSSDGCNDNIIYGRGKSTPMYLNANNVTDNVFINNGYNNNDLNYPNEFNIKARSAVSDNVIMGSSVSFTDKNLSFMKQNTVLNSTWRFTGDVADIALVRNVSLNGLLGVYPAKISCRVSTVSNNVITSNSRLMISNVDQSTVSYNTIMGNSVLFSSYNDGVYTEYNVLTGTYAEGIYGCLSIGNLDARNATIPLSEKYADHKHASSFFNINPNAPEIMYSNRIFNLGHNFVAYSEASSVFGLDNIVSGVDRSFVFGGENKLIHPSSSNQYGCDLSVFGTQNLIHNETTQYDTNIHIFGSNNRIGSQTDNVAAGNTLIVGSYNNLAAHAWVQVNEATIKQIKVSVPTKYMLVCNSDDDVVYLPGNNPESEFIGSGYHYYYTDGALLYVNTIPEGVIPISITGYDLVNGVRNATLINDRYYTSSSTVSDQVRSLITCRNKSIVLKTPDGYYQRTSDIATPYGDRPIVYTESYGNTIIGSSNTINEYAYSYGVLGLSNTVYNNTSTIISCGFVQGNNNTVTDGSNIVCMGNGHYSTGHNSVAIGSQLISNQWQTVIGKYNEAISGPDRLTSGLDDADKALFIIGNGYGEYDDINWMDETYIHRSNAFVVYADGTVKARRFISTSEPSMKLCQGYGITIVDDPINKTSTIGMDSDVVSLLNILNNRPKDADKTYVLQSSGADGVLEWVELGSDSI